MSFLNGLLGQNPEISWHYNTISDNGSLAKMKTKSVAIVKTKGSLGTLKIDCVKIALGALALLAAALIGGPLSYILVAGGAICLYNSVTRYSSGAAGELQAVTSVQAKSFSDNAKDLGTSVTNTIRSVLN